MFNLAWCFRSVTFGIGHWLWGLALVATLCCPPPSPVVFYRPPSSSMLSVAVDESGLFIHSFNVSAEFPSLLDVPLRSFRSPWFAEFRLASGYAICPEI